MKLFTITEFEFTDYPYTQRGINIISIDHISVINDKSDNTIFQNLKSVSFSNNGENGHKVNKIEEIYNGGIYRKCETGKYYILSYYYIDDDINHLF